MRLILQVALLFLGLFFLIGGGICFSSFGNMGAVEYTILGIAGSAAVSAMAWGAVQPPKKYTWLQGILLALGGLLLGLLILMAVYYALPLLRYFS